MILQTTLTLAAAAVAINCWLFLRISQLRMGQGISHGDGGSVHLARRMRAHANFAENTPLFLILIAAIELTGRGGRWLAIVGAVFMLARVFHVFGMEPDKPNPARSGGVIVTLLVQIGLAAAALLIALDLV